jgi:hypothetical protein
MFEVDLRKEFFEYLKRDRDLTEVFHKTISATDGISLYTERAKIKKNVDSILKEKKHFVPVSPEHDKSLNIKKPSICLRNYI